MEISYFAIIIGAIFVNNVVLAQFLGICPFLGVSSKVETSLGMGAAVTFVMALTAVVAWPIQTYILVPLGIEYMQTIVFILVIAALVQMVEIILKKMSPSLYQALGIFLPLITTNCAVLGVAILMIQKEFTLLQSVTYSVAHGPGIRPGAGALRGYPRTARVRGRARGVPRRSHRAHHGQHPRHGLHGLLGAGVAAEPYGKKTPGALRKSSGRLHAGGGGSGRRDAGKPPPSVYRPSSAPSVSQSMERRVKRISNPESQSPTSVSRPIPPSASRVSEE